MKSSVKDFLKASSILFLLVYLFPMLLFAGAVQVYIERANEKQKSHALLIESTSYDYIEIQKEESGIQLLSKVLSDKGYEINLIRNGDRRQVYRSLIDLKRQVGVNDNLIVVISSAVATTRLEDREQTSILFSDIQFQDIEYDGMNLTEFGNLLDELANENQLVILDLFSLGTQFRNLARENYIEPSHSDLNRAIEIQLSDFSRERTLLYDVNSSQRNHRSTDSIIPLLSEGFSGAADNNSDGVIEISEINEFISKRNRRSYGVQVQTSKFNVAEQLSSWKVLETKTKGISSSGAIPVPTALEKSTAQHYKSVLASWALDGFISPSENIRMNSLISHLSNLTVGEIVPKCSHYFRSIESSLATEFENSKAGTSRDIISYKKASQIRQQMSQFPESCSFK